MCLARQDSNPSMVREWRANLLAVGVSESMAAKAYRLLRAALMTEVKEDEILAKNPCRIAGADQEKPSERPVLTIAQVLELADRVPARFKGSCWYDVSDACVGARCRRCNGKTWIPRQGP
jgi:hypothetical protein